MHDRTEAEEQRQRPHKMRNRWITAVLFVLCVFGAALGVAAEYVAHHAGPLLRTSVIATLSERFHSPVELDSLEISVAKGLLVHGRGLRVQYLAGPGRPDIAQAQGHAAPPMLSVREFSFRTSIADLLHRRANLARVEVEGMDLRIPPRASGPVAPASAPAAAHPAKSHIKLQVGTIHCKDVRLVIEPGRPDKAPLRLVIREVQLTGVGSGRPMQYVADLVNPKPVGDIHAVGQIGPWDAEDPRLTALDGRYTFTDVDLSTIHGLRGTLSSVGQFDGHLSRITVDGTTSSADFALDSSGRAEPLNTTFHAYVDGTTGDTTLDPVEAELRHSHITARGDVLRILGKGHDIALDVEMTSGQIQDLLQLTMRAEPPVMRGAVTMHAKLHIPPGQERVSQRMELGGSAQIAGVVFSSDRLQARVNSISVRTSGALRQARAGSAVAPSADVASKLAATFSLHRGVVLVPSLQYEIPGASVQMAGVYLMDGRAFEFRGHARTQATASQMVTGWKSALLRPFDGMFRKDGAGMEFPVQISGTKDSYSVGFASHRVDQTPKEMESNLKELMSVGGVGKPKP